jgi:hypothetical protein
MIKKKIKKLHIGYNIKTYSWYGGSFLSNELIISYFKEYHTVIEAKQFRNKSFYGWDLEVDYVDEGTPKEGLLTYINRIVNFNN